MLRYWYGDYVLLEDNHNYIQWYMFQCLVILWSAILYLTAVS